MTSRLTELRGLYQSELWRTVDFWLSHAVDAEHGGLYNSLDREGRLFSKDKGVWLLGRALWLFSRLCNDYGERPEWRQAAESCYAFLNEHCIDPEDGRMFFLVQADGTPLRKRRYFFSETFYIMGCSEYARAFGDFDALAAARQYYDLVHRIYLDPASDPYKITPKIIPGARETRSFAAPMILLNVSHVMQDNDPEHSVPYQHVAEQMTADIFRYFYKPELHALLEMVGEDGAFLRDATGGRTVNPGHILECVWFLMAQAKRTGDNALVKKAEALFRMAMERGWDAEFGGILYFTDALGFPPEQIEHDMKLWWPHCEALIAAIWLFEETGNPDYWAWFEKLTAYAFEHFSDKEHGEWYGYLGRDGKPTQPALKGGLFKGIFHLPRMLLLVEQALGRLAAEQSGSN